MPQTLEWTIRTVLEWTTDYFKTHQIDSPRITAEVLLAHTLALKRIDLYLRYDQPLLECELTVFKKYVRRRLAYEPVAYIIGSKEFWSLDFEVTPAVLIPRPDTECLVETALTLIPNQPEDSAPRRILELGTGSGAIIIALAVERPVHFFVACDKSMQAILQAKKNAVKNDAMDRIAFLCCDWFEALNVSCAPFDLIVSNPPYVRSVDIAALPPEINQFEPLTALDSGPDGLDALTHIIVNAPRFVVSGGTVLLETGYDQRPAVERIAESTGQYRSCECKKDLEGRDRVMQLTRL